MLTRRLARTLVVLALFAPLALVPSGPASADTQACGDLVPLEEATGGGSRIVGWVRPCLTETPSELVVTVSYQNISSAPFYLTTYLRLYVNNPPAPRIEIPMICQTGVAPGTTWPCVARASRSAYPGGLHGWAKAWAQAYDQNDEMRANVETPVLFS